jgi:hypothetical protein
LLPIAFAFLVLTAACTRAPGRGSARPPAAPAQPSGTATVISTVSAVRPDTVSGASPGVPPATASPAPHSFFDNHRIVAFYGNPASPVLGVLGDGTPQAVLPRLRQQAASYAIADPSRQVVPAMELIDAVAQDTPTDNGLYLYRMDADTVDRYTQVAADNGLLLILDEQIGRSTAVAETQRLLPRLAADNVELALDPEFTMPPGEVPGRDIGSMDAEDINAVQQILEDLAVRQGLASKILIIHEFQNGMVTHLDQLRAFPHVDLVLDADGFGARSTKLEKYAALIAGRPAGHAGVKLFYKYDPDIWAPDDVLHLAPPPDVVIYQ